MSQREPWPKTHLSGPGAWTSGLQAWKKKHFGCCRHWVCSTLGSSSGQEEGFLGHVQLSNLIVEVPNHKDRFLWLGKCPATRCRLGVCRECDLGSPDLLPAQLSWGLQAPSQPAAPQSVFPTSLKMTIIGPFAASTSLSGYSSFPCSIIYISKRVPQRPFSVNLAAHVVGSKVEAGSGYVKKQLPPKCFEQRACRFALRE